MWRVTEEHAERKGSPCFLPSLGSAGQVWELGAAGATCPAPPAPDLALASRIRASKGFIPQGTKAGREQERSWLRSSTCQSVRKGICLLLQLHAQP